MCQYVHTDFFSLSLTVQYNNYLHIIYVVLGIISNLKMIQTAHEDMLRLYVNTVLFYIRNLSILRFGYLLSRGGA